MNIEGGCLCGNIRYQIDAEPVDAGFCHCRLCQRSSGAPTLAWLTLPIAGFRYTGDEAAVFHSSDRYQREFCPTCGTQLVFRASTDPTTIDVTLCSLDDSSVIGPQYHIWTQSKVSWLHIGDDLPQYPDAGPDTD